MNDSKFYRLAEAALHIESKRLCDFTDSLDKDPGEKKNRIADYKCAKYRYASVSEIHSALYNNNLCRKAHNLKYSHHLLLPFDEIFTRNAAHLALYESAPEEEQPDYSLYYGMVAFADEQIEKYESKIAEATDWERIELTERIGGLHFAKECLSEAWKKRKDAAL